MQERGGPEVRSRLHRDRRSRCNIGHDASSETRFTVALKAAPAPNARTATDYFAHVPPRVLLALVSAAALLTGVACSPAYSIHEVAAPGFDLEGEALVHADAGVRFAYDFWGPEGAPFVSVLNETSDTIVLDLRGSRVTAVGAEMSLAEVLDGGLGEARFIQDNYPRLDLVRRPLGVRLVPGQWAEFYGLPQVASRYYGGNGRRGESSYTYRLVTEAGAPATVTHVFRDRVRERLRRRSFRDLQASTPAPDWYYLDRNPQRRAIALEVFVAIGQMVWLL